MSKPKTQKQARKGSAKAAEVQLGDKRKRAFLASIENDGRDERGRIVGTNGIKWVIA